MTYKALKTDDVIFKKGKIVDNLYIFLHGNFKEKIEIEKLKEESDHAEEK